MTGRPNTEKQTENQSPRFSEREGQQQASGATTTGHERGARDALELQNVLNASLEISLRDIPLEEQLQLILQRIVAIPWLALESRGAVFLVQDEPGVLVLKSQHQMPAAILSSCARVPFGRCLCGRAASSGELQFADRVDDRHEVRYPGISPHGHYCVPIISRGKVLGVLNLYVRAGHVRNRTDEEFLPATAAVFASVIEHARVEQQLTSVLSRLRKALGGTIEALALTVERRDPYTAGHQKRVAHLSRAIGDEIGLPRPQIEAVRMAGAIHDIGKVSVPAEILSKPGRLTDLELSLIKTHPTVGYEILKEIEFPWPIARIVLQHHERMNGSGYPEGLSGQAILIEARILGVADVVEAMASHRPYRPALSIEEALEEISHKKGMLYDAIVVDACLRLFKEKGFRLE